MVPHLRKYLALVFSLLLSLSGCRLDDDSSYEIRTYSSFFLVQKPDGNLSLYRYVGDDHTLEAEWNQNASIPDADLSDAEMIDNMVWIASGPQKAVLQVNPTYGSVQQRFGDLPLSPHHIAIGEKQMLIADSAAHKVAFVKLRNGDVQEIEFTGKPGMALYNSGKFYLQVDDSLVAIYDESAMTTRATVSIGKRLDALMLNRYHAIVVMTHDTSTSYRATIDPNADYLIGEVYPVFYTQLLPTPYFSKRFGNEYLLDLEVLNTNLIDEHGLVLADSIQDFEADFFEGTLFYTHGQDFVVKSIDSLITRDSLTFQGTFIKSFHQYAAD
jgi:hypothetical protein